MRIRFLLLSILPLLLFTTGGNASFYIVREGKIEVSVEYPAELHRNQLPMVRDLESHIQLLGSGEVVSRALTQEEAAQPRPTIRIPTSTIRLQLSEAGFAEPEMPSAAFRLIVQPRLVLIESTTPTGLQAGVSEVLEQLGFRWYWPGEIGRVVPAASPEHKLALQDRVHRPDFHHYQLGSSDRDWSRRNRTGGQPPPGILTFPSLGSIDEFPQVYALFNGERRTSQLCVSNPETSERLTNVIREAFTKDPNRKWFALSNHGAGHCECPDCLALDSVGPEFGPFTGGRNITDRYIPFLNRILENLESEFPDRRIAFSVSTPHILPPTHERVHPNMDIGIWPAGICRFHGPNNPICPERQMVLNFYREWIELMDGELFERSDWGNLAGPGFLFPTVQKLRRMIPAYHEVGVGGIRVIGYSHWASEGPSSWIGSRLLWDTDAPVDELLEEFYQLFYGPAAGPMKAYHELLESTLEGADYHAGSALDHPRIYGHPDIWNTLQESLQQAKQQVGEASPYADRVRANQLAFEFLGNFILMIEARDAHDYATAVRYLEAAREKAKALLEDFDTPLLRSTFAPGYLNRFFGTTVESGYQHAVEEGNFVVGLNDSWDFLTDPEQLGYRQEWFSPELRGGNWGKISAWESNWGSQGLRNYLGVAWYRQQVDLPEKLPEGKSFHLWIGGMDGQLQAWWNGVQVADLSVAVFEPVVIDLPQEAIAPGTENVLVLRFNRASINELGTGGLLAPVFVFSR